VVVERGELMNERCLESLRFRDGFIDFFRGHGKRYGVYFFNIFFNYGILSSLSKFGSKCVC
jgi:hypothetical protein